jgi:plastocyanin domain-containing protein
LGLEVGVTVGGIALIGLELWWFLFSKTQSQQAKASEGIQEMTITVDGGYEPSRVVVKVGQPVRLNFVRRDPSSCLEKVYFLIFI